MKKYLKKSFFKICISDPDVLDFIFINPPHSKQNYKIILFEGVGWDGGAGGGVLPVLLLPPLEYDRSQIVLEEDATELQPRYHFCLKSFCRN